MGTPVTLTQHDAAYDTTLTYRGNITGSSKMGTSTSYAYDIGGNPHKMQDGDGMTISLATGSSIGGTLPALLIPNSNSVLVTLVLELSNVKSAARPSGRLKVSAEGSSEHDDLVLAVALAVWRGRMPGAGEQPRRLL
jgi:hypothetical protein